MQPEDDETPVRMNVDRIFAAMIGDEGQNRVHVPPWFWDQELNDRERREEMLEGQVPIEVNDELQTAAKVLYFEDGDHEPRDTTSVELKVPVLETWRNAILDAEENRDDR